VQVDDDVGRIEQYDQMLSEVGDRIDVQIGLAEQHGAGPSATPNDARTSGEIDIREILRHPRHWRLSRFACYLSGTVEHTTLGAGDLLPDRCQDVHRKPAGRGICRP